MQTGFILEVLFWRNIKQLIKINVVSSFCWLFNIIQITFGWLSNFLFLQTSYWFESFLHRDFVRIFSATLVQRKIWGGRKRWREIINKTRAASSWYNWKIKVRCSGTGVWEGRRMIVTHNGPNPLIGHAKDIEVLEQI